MTEDPPQDRPPEFGARSRTMRPPNKKKLEEEMDAYLETIRILEVELKSLGKPSKESSPAVTEERTKLNGNLKKMRAGIMQTIERRKEKETELLQVRSEITQKGDKLSKLEASLAFRTNEDLASALKNLEYQLQHKKLTSREENRLVREIENLKKSRSKVREYNQKKKVIEADKDRRLKIREEKNKYFNQVSDMKKQEEVIKQRLKSINMKEDEAWLRFREGGERRALLKADIDAQYEKKRQALANHKLEQEKYKQYMKEYKEGEKKRLEETRRERNAERLKQKREYDEVREPYLEERQKCSALIKYLQSHIPQDHEEANLNPAAKVRNSSESLYQRDNLESEFTILRRKGDSDDDSVHQSSTRRKKGRRQRRHSGHNKSLRHSHQIFLQFLSLKVEAPPTMAEVVETLVKLRSKLDYLEKLAKDEKMGQSDVSSSHGSDLTMSDYSTGTNDLLQDHDLIEDEEPIPEVFEETEEDSQFLPSDTSKDDGIHSLSSNSTVNDLESNTDTPIIPKDNLKSESINLERDGDGSRHDERSVDTKESQMGQDEINDDHLVKNNLSSENHNGFNDANIIPKESDISGGFLSSGISHVRKSIEGCSLGENITEEVLKVDGSMLNGGEINSNNSNARNAPSKTQTVEYIRTLSDTINQNESVVVTQS